MIMSSLQAWLLVLLLVAIIHIPSVEAQLAVRLVYTFDYGFFPNSVRNAPSVTEFNDLICLHNDYMTALYQENSANPNLIFEAVNIDWTFDETELDFEDGVPLQVIFAADLSTTDGISSVPSPAAVALYPFDHLQFIVEYLHTSDSDVWTKVASLSNSEEITRPNAGQLERGVCDGTFQEAAEAGVTRPPRTEPTKSPTTAPTVNPVRVVMVAIEYAFTNDESTTPTEEEKNDLMCLTDSFFSAWLQEITLDPSTNVEGRAIQTSVNADRTIWIMVALTIKSERIEPDPVRIVAEINVASRIVKADYIENYCWQAQPGSLFRTVSSVDFFGSISNDPLLKGLRRTCIPPTPAPTISPIPTTLTPTTAGATFNPTTIAPTTAGATPNPTIAGVTPNPTNVVGTPTPTINGATPNPTVAASPKSGTWRKITSRRVQSGSDEFSSPVVVQMDFAFDDGDDRAPTTKEVANLLCRTDEFFLELMIDKTGDDTIETYGSLLEVNYNDQAPIYAISVVFASNTTYSTTGEPVAPEVVEDVLTVTRREILTYIEDFVLDTSEDDVFYGAIAVEFDIKIQDQLSVVAPWPNTCAADERGDTDLPTAAGTPSPTTAGTQSPTAAGTQSPTASSTTSDSNGKTPSKSKSPQVNLTTTCVQAHRNAPFCARPYARD